jgi:hypothetical protein
MNGGSQRPPAGNYGRAGLAGGQDTGNVGGGCFNTGSFARLLYMLLHMNACCRLTVVGKIVGTDLVTNSHRSGRFCRLDAVPR